MHDTAPTTSPQAVEGQPEQLTLQLPLAPTSLPLQFRLDERTRRRGLAEVARLRQQLAAQAARRAAAGSASAADEHAALGAAGRSVAA